MRFFHNVGHDRKWEQPTRPPTFPYGLKLPKLIIKFMYEDLLSRLRRGKDELRRARRNMSLPEKVKQVVEKITLPAIRRRRALNDWECVWPLRDR
jgi:hypothetical protein